MVFLVASFWEEPQKLRFFLSERTATKYGTRFRLFNEVLVYLDQFEKHNEKTAFSLSESWYKNIEHGQAEKD